MRLELAWQYMTVCIRQNDYFHVQCPFHSGRSNLFSFIFCLHTVHANLHEFIFSVAHFLQNSDPKLRAML